MEYFQTPMPDENQQPVSNLIASVIANLPQGIIICDGKAKILLANHRAASIISTKEERQPDLSHGQMVSELIDPQLIDHALDEINHQLKKKIVEPVSYFIFKNKDNTIQSKVVPILDETKQFKGFVLVLNDITRQNKIDKKVETILRSLAKNTRSPIASIRAAIEAMREFPDMAENRLERFKNIIYDESITLSAILNEASENYVSMVGTKENIIPVQVGDLLETLARRAHDKLNIALNIEKTDPLLFILADRYALMMMLLFFLIQLKNKTGYSLFFISVSEKKKVVKIDIQWPGDSISSETVKGWEEQYPDVEGQIFPMTVKETLDIHHSAVWPYDRDEHGDMPSLRLFIPGEQEPALEPMENVHAMPEAALEYYDPDLFDSSGLDPELDNRLLTELNYTALVREINQAESLNDIIGKHSQLPRLIQSMITSGTKTGTVTWLITTFADSILSRLMKFALDEMGPAPVRFAFMTMGSEGRQEQTLKTDQDNAIVYEDIPAESELDENRVKTYFLELGDTVCNWLDRSGYDYCLGGVMAKNLKWCQPLSVWKKYFSQWLSVAEPEHLLHTSIFFDFRFAFGYQPIIEELRKFLNKSVNEHPAALRFMAKNALSFRPPLGFWGNFALEKNSEGNKGLDIKKAMTPIVDFARIYALKNGVSETNTKARLYQLYQKQELSKDDFSQIEQAYSFLLQIRLMGQINAIIGENIKADNFVYPGRLSGMEQRMLKEVFKNIRLYQTRLKREFLSE